MSLEQVVGVDSSYAGRKVYRYGDGLGGVLLALIALLFAFVWDFFDDRYSRVPLTGLPLLLLVLCLWRAAKYYCGPKITVDDLGITRETASQRTRIHFDDIDRCTVQRRGNAECLIIESVDSRITLHGSLAGIAEIVETISRRCPAAWPAIPLPYRVVLRPFGIQTVVAALLSSLIGTVLVTVPFWGRDSLSSALVLVWAVVCVALIVAYKLRRNTVVLWRDRLEYVGRISTRVYHLKQNHEITSEQIYFSLDIKTSHDTKITCSDSTKLTIRSERIPGSSLDFYRILRVLYAP